MRGEGEGEARERLRFFEKSRGKEAVTPKNRTKEKRTDTLCCVHMATTPSPLYSPSYSF